MIFVVNDIVIVIGFISGQQNAPQPGGGQHPQPPARHQHAPNPRLQKMREDDREFQAMKARYDEE